MTKTTLSHNAIEAFNTAIRSTQTVRNTRRIAQTGQRLPSAHQIISGYEYLEKEYEDPRFLAHTFMGWVTGYRLDELATLLGVEEGKIARVWSSAGLTEITAQVDMVSEGNSQLERHVAECDRDVNVTMGTTPTGMPSLANLYTFVRGAGMVKRVVDDQGKSAHIVFGINDHLVGSNEPELPRRIEAITAVIDRISEELDIEIKIQRYSQMQRSAPFRRLLQRVADHGMFACSKSEGVPLWEMPNGKGEYQHICGTEANSRTDYERSGSDFATDLAGTVLLRNAVVGSNVHAIGGDVNHALKLADKAAQLGVASPVVYTTGVMYGPDGEEMHASSRNTFTLRDLQSQGTWVRDLANLRPRPSGEIGPLEYRGLLTSEAAARIYMPRRDGLRSPYVYF